jgi:lysozyme
VSDSKVLETIAREEGLRLFVYDDANGKAIKPGSVVLGHPTIGYGRALDTKGISQDEASLMRLNDQGEAEGTFADQELGWWANLSTARQDVVALMVFQLGARGFREFKGMIEAIKAKDFTRAALEMLDSEWAKQTPARARRMAELMRTGRYS